MSQKAKIRVAVLYGGRSGEHDISLLSAKAVLENIDTTKFEAIPVGIGEDGQWYFNDLSVASDAESDGLLVSNEHSTHAIPHADPTQESHFDVVFPVLHGRYGEDGTVQGLLELANIPYVGCGVLSSALCMDKDITKRLVEAIEIPIVDYYTLSPSVLEDPSAVKEFIAEEFNYPVFIKPANCGSSEGVSKVNNEEELILALELAFSLDKKVLLEPALEVRDIEVGVLQSSDNDEPLVSRVVGEIINHKADFYSKAAKFDEGYFPETVVPANISSEQLATLRTYAADIFTALECEGLARVDFFIEKKTGQIYFNEINTLPGFTQMSLYPVLWHESGMSYTRLLTHLIELALAKTK